MANIRLKSKIYIPWQMGLSCIIHAESGKSKFSLSFYPESFPDKKPDLFCCKVNIVIFVLNVPDQG